MRTKLLLFLWVAASLLSTGTACSHLDTDGSEEDIPTVNAGVDEGVDGHYRIGDVYSRGSVTGVVFRIDEQGVHGLIVSPGEATEVQWACREHVRTLAKNLDSGKENMRIIEALADWETTFPAFKWCADLNKSREDDWYLPSINELTALYRAYNGGSIKGINVEEQAKFNRTLERCGGVPIQARQQGPFILATYWSSTVYREYSAFGLGECDVRVVEFTGPVTDHHYSEEYKLRVRAVHAF